MSSRARLWGAVPLALILGGLSAPAHGIGFQMVTTSPSGTVVLPPCGVAGLNSCPAFISGLQPVLKSMVKKNIDLLYTGGVPTITVGNPPTSVPLASGPLLPTPVCNLSDQVYTGGAGEVATSHVGASCGQNCQFTCAAPPAPSSPTATPLPINCTWDAASCTTERSWGRGAVVQSVWYFYDQVMEEIAGNTQSIDSLGYPHLTLNNSNCDVAVTNSQFSGMVGDMNKSVNMYIQLSGNNVLVCPGAPGSTAVTSPSKIPMNVQQAGCYLLAARTFIENTIAPLALCEIFGLAESRWDRTLPNPKAVQYDNLVNQAAQQAIANPACTKSGMSASAVQSCLQTQYNSAIQSLFNTTLGQEGSGFTSAPTQ